MPSAKKQPKAKKAPADKKAMAKKATPTSKQVKTKQAAAKKKPAAKKPAAKKPAAKKPAAKKPAAKKPAAKKPAAKKPAAKKPAAKKRSKQVTCPLSGLQVTPGSPRFAPATLHRLRTLLEEERERHVHQAEELQAEADELATERDQGDTQFDEESGEGDTVSVERERSLLLSASARHAVEEIDRALARMDSGTYGVCVPAGRPINLVRLEAIPWAETCVECAKRVARPR